MWDIAFTLVNFGFREFVAPALFWVVLFFFLAFGTGAFTFLWFKKRFEPISKIKLVCLGLLFFIVFPLSSAHLGFLFSIQRFTGKLLETGAKPIMQFSVTLGSSAVQQYMGTLTAQTLVEIEPLRQKTKKMIEEARLKTNEHTSNPFLLLIGLPQFLERTFWKKLEEAVDTFEEKTLTWEHILKKVEGLLAQEGEKIFFQQSKKFYRSAYLYIFCSVLVYLVCFFLSFFFLKKFHSSKKIPIEGVV